MLNAVPSECVNHQPLLVGSYHFLGRRLQIENTFVEVDNRVDEWRLDVQTGLADHSDRLAKADHQRLLRLINGEQRRESDDQRGYAKKCEDAAEKIQSHCRPPPAVGHAFAVVAE